MKSNLLPQLRQAWFLEQVRKLHLEAPGVVIAKKTGISEGQVSHLLKGTRPVTDNFLRTFCQAFKLDYRKADKAIKLQADEIAASEESGTLPLNLVVKPSKKKEVIILGKNPNQRLKPEQYSEAFGDWQGLPMYNTPITATFVETYRDDSIYQPQ